MRNFPSRTESPTFGSLHRHRPHATWSSTDNTGSPQEGRTQFFQRSDSIPVHVAHESHQGSRSSTPESTASGHSRPGSNGTEQLSSEELLEDNSSAEGMEEHPSVSARQGKTSFTARRQPKIHHIPIHVEPRDGSQPVVLTPPVDGTTTPSSAAASSSSTTTSTRVIPQPETESPSTPRRRTTQPVVFAMPAPEENHKNRRQASGTGGSSAAAAAAAASQSDDNRYVRSIPIRMESTSTKEPEDSSKEAPPPPSSPPKDKRRQDPSEVVEEVRLDVENLRKCVEEFKGVRGDKQYLYLDEMLTRNLIRLDNISTEGNEELRKARRAVIDAINCCIQEMEQKVSTTGANDVSTEEETSSYCQMQKEALAPENKTSADALTEVFGAMENGSSEATEQAQEESSVENTLQTKEGNMPMDVSAQEVNVSVTEAADGSSSECGGGQMDTEETSTTASVELQRDNNNNAGAEEAIVLTDQESKTEA